MNVSWGKVSTALGVVIWLTSGTVIASTPITGVTMEGPSNNQSGTVAALPRTYGWVSLNETLSPGQRLVMNKDFFDDIFQEFPHQSEFDIGIKDPVNWSNTASIFSGAFVNDHFIRIVKYSSGNTIARHYTGSNYTGLTDVILTWTDYEAFFELTADGNNIRYGQRYGTTGSNNPTYTHDIDTTQYPDWDSSNKTETGQQGYGYTSAEVVIRMSGITYGQEWDTANIDWTALTLRSIPAQLNITYDTQGGSDVTDGDATTTTGGTINALPSDPTRDGYTFTGWYTASSGGTEITTEAAHNQTADFTLYAQWTANPTTTVAPTTTTAAPTTTTTTAAPTTSMLPATGSSNGTLSQVLLVLGVGGLLALVARRRLNVCDSRDSPLKE